MRQLPLRPLMATLIGIGLAITPHSLTAQADTLSACVATNGGGDAIGRVRLVGATESCRVNETRVHWNISGPQGPQGAQGPEGPKGDKGEDGAPGSTLLGTLSMKLSTGPYHNYQYITSYGAGSGWQLIGPGFAPTHAITATTTGAPVMFHLNVPFYANGTSRLSCGPTVDGAWAGAFSDPGADSDHREGIISTTSTANPHGVWHSTRVYPVPAGAHTFGIQCRALYPSNVYIGAPPYNFGSSAVTLVAIELR